MNYKLKKIFTNFKVLLLLFFVIASFFIVSPALNSDGVAIRTISVNSSAALAGMSGPSPNSLPMQREIIKEINNIPIKDVNEYNEYVSTIPPNMNVYIKTNKGEYSLKTKELLNMTIIGYDDVVVEKINETTNQTYNITEKVPKIDGSVLGTQNIGLSVYEAPSSNLRLGLDLQGGTRVLLSPESEVDESTLDIIIESLKERLNVYGLSDMIIRPTSDLSGNKYVLVEIPGANQEEVQELISKQGKFEAKIGNESVFLGGDDITYVCKTAECSGIDPSVGCGLLADGKTWSCGFNFAITLSQSAAQKQASITNKLDVVLDSTSGKSYLSKDLDLYLDDSLVDSLKISDGLKGQQLTDIAISGSGQGSTQQDAINDALKNMKRLQTIIVTGSLPVKMNVVKADSISPSLGEDFIRNILLMGVLAILGIALVIFLKYKTWKIAVPMVFIMGAELVMILGFGAISGWSLDIAAIAGIIIAIGTGVDSQIVIADEILRGEKLSGNYSWSQKIKRAFSIIMVAYLTTAFAMAFLWFAGAGLLKGFATTTILGISLGVFVSRPAFAAIIETLLKNE
jgi:preprotein translocase subunit SecD